MATPAITTASTASPTPTPAQAPTQATPSPFPLPQATASAVINTHHTTATRLSFADKTLLTLTQSGALTHWLHVPLLAESPLTDPSTHLLPSQPVQEEGEDGAAVPDASLLPFPHLTATTVLGGTKEEDAVVGQTLAVTVASAVLMKQGGGGGGGEGAKMMVFGLGLVGAGGGAIGRAEFEELVGLCLEVL